MKKIKISILISTYNRYRELKSCIDSLLSVDFPLDDYEILVGDGGSTDNTKEYMMQLVEKSKQNSEKFPIIRYFREKKNLGGLGNRIRPLIVSNGKYVCTLDSDAVVPKDWLKNIYFFMESQGLDVSGSLQLTDPKKGPCIGFDLGKFGESVKPYRIKEPLYISGVATFFKKSTLLKMGGFDPIMIYGGADMDLGIRARYYGAKILGDISTVVDHTKLPIGEHVRAPKNSEKYMYFQFSRVIYIFLKNFEWRYGINFALRYFLLCSYEAFKGLKNKDLGIVKGYLKAIFWIFTNLGIIFINHKRVIRKIKGFQLVKKFFHQDPFSIKKIFKPD
ncbi:MAG: glycosyltransferase family 2 protein [Candidatus Helarchaeota archaeon]